MTDQLVSAYASASHRILFFDYDGVLAPIVSQPDRAAPSDTVLMLLGLLSTQRNTKVVVVSGRNHETLEQWLGALPIDMSAEHGHFARESGTWDLETDIDVSWRGEVEAEMKELVREYPGSHIETKRASVVWHYRQAIGRLDPQRAEKRIIEVARGRATVMSGKSVIDVRALGADKGDAVRRWCDAGKWDFTLCIGDDVTDESMFVALPASSWTIKVGPGPTQARLRLDDQKEVIVLLKALIAAGSDT